MRARLVAISVSDPASLRASLSAALGTSSVDLCQATEAAVTWLENRPCDLVTIAGQGAAVADGVARIRRVSKTIPVLVVVPDSSTREAGAAWLNGADDVVTASALTAGTLPEGLDDVRHPERDVVRRIQRLWYAGPPDALRNQLATRLGARFREVGLSAEGLAGLTTQDVENPHSAALIVNALAEAESLVLGVRRVKRTYPGLAVTVVADGTHHQAFRRAGADECVVPPADADTVLHAMGRAQATCRTSLELDIVRARETRLRALLEHLPEAVMLVSPEHAVLAVNLAALRLIGAQDARQVIGTPLAPWFAGDDEHAPIALVDGVAAGSPRELFTRTRHLADPRGLQLRAVPFQRETGGSPAALIVLREVVDASSVDAASAPAGASDADRQAWDEERRAFVSRVDSLAAELTDARTLAESLREAQATLAASTVPSDERDAWLRERADLATRIEVLDADLSEARALADAQQTNLLSLNATIDSLRDAQEAVSAAAVPDEERDAWTRERDDLTARIDALSTALDEARAREQAPQTGQDDAARRLAVLEQEEMPLLLSRIDSQQQLHDENVTALRDALARVQALEGDEIPALRDIAEAARADAARIADALDAAQQRAAELEAALADASTRAADLELEVAHARVAPPPIGAPVETVAIDLPPEQRWLLQEVAHIGLVRTTGDGRVLEANDHAAALCGHGRGADLVDAGRLPEPLALIGDPDDRSAARFEVCLQTTAGQPPRWVAGARLARTDDAGEVTWLLADASVHHAGDPGEMARPEAFTAILEAVAAECATIVDRAPTVRGPRPIDAAPMDRETTDALERARVLLQQVASVRKRREAQAAIDELSGHLQSLEPVLARLATEDVTWELAVPDAPVHVCASASDVERCVTGLVTSARDALPLGGRLSLSVETPGPAMVDGDFAVRRLDARLTLSAQGYGVLPLDVPPALRDLAAAFGGEFDVARADALTQRIVLRLPRAFVVSHAA
ncbi:MAG: PAS domain-containing protein [Acidobacteria bacterium]|nr:PAS domain-containing protein [Acidobacteriota bacterium]